MPAPTLDDQDEKLNPGQQEYLRNFENGGGNRSPGAQFNANRGDDNSQQAVAQGEKRAISDSAVGKAAVDSAAAAASAGGTPIAGKIVKALGKIKTKKGGIGATIVGVLVGLIILIVGVTGPGLLIVHIEKIVTEQLNSQLTSFENRSNSIFLRKMSGAAEGLCTQAVSIRCRYSTFSKPQADLFEQRSGGRLKVVSDGTTRFGRVRPTGFEFDGRVIPPNRFMAELRNNPDFRATMHKAYPTKFITLADWVNKKVGRFYGLTRNKALQGDSDDERRRKIQENTKNGFESDNTSRRIGPDDKKPDGSDYTDEERAHINNSNDFADSAQAEADRIARGSEQSAVRRALTGGAQTAARAVSVAGMFDAACGGYGMIQAVGYGLKIKRAAQLARFASILLNVASRIQEDVATPEEVEYLGNNITTVMRDQAGNVTTRAGTDGFGWKNIAYGDTGTMPDSSVQYMVGGGLGGQMTQLTSLINSTLGGNPRDVCRIIQNPWVSGASIVAGVALMFIPGVNIAWTGKTAASLTLQGAIQVAMAFLPAMLIDIWSGQGIDPAETVGEESLDATISGSGEILGKTAQFGANGPMTVDQAVEYKRASNLLVAQYAEEERLAKKWYDPYSQYTLVGSIVSNSLPILSSTGSISSALGSIGSVFSRSVRSLSPTADALTEEQYRRSLESCQDFDYRDFYGDGSNVRIATTPFCNVIYGVPVSYLDEPNAAILDRLDGQWDELTGEPVPGSEYATFVEDCINRTTPLNYAGETQQEDNGTKCLFTDENRDFYLLYMDMRALYSMEDIEPDNRPPVADTPTVVSDGQWVNPMLCGQYRISSRYGMRTIFGKTSLHNGVDMAAPFGTPYRAAASGVVTEVARQSWGTNYIKIDHGGGYSTEYGHSEMTDILVKRGDTVTAGQVIALVGSQGEFTTGPHVHFNYRAPGQGAIDPIPAMKARGVDLEC